jgi:hypothetical protein
MALSSSGMTWTSEMLTANSRRKMTAARRRYGNRMPQAQRHARALVSALPSFPEDQQQLHICVQYSCMHWMRTMLTAMFKRFLLN